MTWGMVQLPGNNREYSVYATEAYYTGPDSRVRRFVYRVDGFVSATADSSGGRLLTGGKPHELGRHQPDPGTWRQGEIQCGFGA